MDTLETPMEQPAPPEPPLETESVTPADFEALMQRHAQMERQQRQSPSSLNLEEVQTLVAELRALSKTAEGEQHQTLEAAQRRWTALLELRRAMIANRRGGIPVWALMLITVAGMLTVSLGISWMLRRDVTPTAQPSQIGLVDRTPTPRLIETQATPLATPVLEMLPSPTPMFLVLPTVTPIPTTEATPIPTAEATSAPTVMPHADPGGDVASLAGRQAVSAPPPGVDSVSCNIDADALVLRAAPPSFTVVGAEDETRLTLWLRLAEPVPAQRALTYHWLLALDVDGNAGTGRPKGAGYINPDLGTEIGAGVFLYPDGRFEPYLYIWDNALGDWTSGARVPDILQVTLNEARDGLAFNLPLVELSAAIQSISGVTFDAALLKGRLGTITSSNTVAAVVDFCPDLP